MEYEIEYLDNKGNKVKDMNRLAKVRVRSNKNKLNYADHSHVYLKNPSNGRVYGKIAISDLPNQTVLDKLSSQGSSESIILPLNPNLLGTELKLEEIDTEEDLIHYRGITEHSFTSTGSKLDYHWPIFQNYKKLFGSIVRSTLTLHQRCSSKCPYCSTINRKSDDEISLEEAKEFINKLYIDQAKYNKEFFPTYNERYKKLQGQT